MVHATPTVKGKVQNETKRLPLKRFMPFLVFGSCLFYLSLTYDYGLNMKDEGYLLAGVIRILEGQIPHIDFFQNYSPGRFYLFAAVFKFFGADLLLIRKFWVCLIALSAVLAFALTIRIAPLWAALIPPVLLTVVPFPIYGSFFIFIPLLNLYLNALYFENKISAFWFGFVTGLTILFRQDVGFIGVVVGLTAIAIRNKITLENQASNMNKKNSIIRGGAEFCTGIASALLPLFYYYWSHSGLTELFSQILFGGLQTNRGIPLPFPDIRLIIRHLFNFSALHLLIVFYAPFLIYALSLGIMIKSFLTKRMDKPPVIYAMILLTGLLILPQSFIRSDFSHMSQVLPPFFLLLAYWIHYFIRVVRKKSIILFGRIVSLTISFVLIGAALYVCIYHTFLYYNERSPFFTKFSRRFIYFTLENPRARVRLLPHDKIVVNSIVQMISEHTGKEDYLLCMPYDSIFNFLTGLRNPTRYDIFFPGVMDGSKDQQDSIIESIKHPKLKYIIFDDRPPDDMENRRMKYYIPDLYNYILRHFELEKTIGPYSILRRREEPHLLKQRE